MTSPLLAKALQAELERKEAIQEQPIPDVLADCFPKQREFIDRPEKRKILCLPRRSGKSNTVAFDMVDQALRHPGSSILYVCLTKSEAIKIMWGDIFKVILNRHNIKAELVKYRKEIVFENESTIYLGGIDSSPREMEKLRGKKYRLVIIDECQSFKQDLKQFINQILGPTLADLDATIVLCGTAGDQMGEHYWWTLNKPESPEKGWTTFSWTFDDLPEPHRGAVRKYVDGLISDNPLVQHTSWFRKEWLNEWVADADLRVYRSTLDNYIDIITRPADRPSAKFLEGATFILSMDLGYYDATSFLIGAHNRKVSNRFYVLESFKKANLIDQEVAEIIQSYRLKYRLDHMVLDAANVQMVEGMRQKYKLPLKAAEKHGKEAHIALLNSDFVTQNVFIVKNHNEQLIKELDQLIWDTQALLNKNKRKENGKYDNHLTDALLYAHHFSRHYWFTPAHQIDRTTTDENVQQQLEEYLGIDRKKTHVKQLRAPWIASWLDPQDIKE